METFKKYLAWAGIGMFIYMPFHILISQWFSTYTGGLEIWKGWKDALTVVLALLCIVMVVWQRKYTRLYWWLLGLMSAYGALHVLLVFTTDQPLDTGLLATTYNLRIFAYLLIGYSLALLIPKQFNVRRLAKILLIVSTVVCLIGLAQWVLPKDIMTNFGYSIDRGMKPSFFIDDKPDLPRIFSTIRDPNSLGAFLILPITLLTYGVVRFWNTNRRMLLSGLLTLHVLALLLTFSRSALIGTVISLVALGALTYRKRLVVLLKRYAVPLALLCIVTVGGVVAFKDTYLVQNVVFHADESTTLDDPNELRLKLYQKGIDGIVEDPEGNGPGTAGLVSTRLPNGLLTENYYLQIAYEVGVIGFLLFVSLLGLAVYQLWLRRTDPLVHILLASFAGLAFMSLLLHTWANEAVAITWFLLAGTALAQASRPTHSKNRK